MMVCECQVEWSVGLVVLGFEEGVRIVERGGREVVGCENDREERLGHGDMGSRYVQQDMPPRVFSSQARWRVLSNDK